MTDSIYLDYAATAPMRREVLEAMFPLFQQTFGNPSSVHSVGADARAALDLSRDRVASILGCGPEEIIFTSGGTESDNLALLGVARASGPSGHVVVSAVEHEAVLESAAALRKAEYEVSLAPVDAYGVVHPEAVAELVREDTVLVSCMLANNEIGTLENIPAIKGAVHAKNPSVVIHTDAVQAAGALDLNVDRLGVDLMSLSGHKIGGPRGIGVLYVRRGTPIQPIVYGGGQEHNRRSGTENVAGAVGMAEALSLAQGEREQESPRLSGLRDRLIQGVTGSSCGVRLTGHPTNRLPGHASFVLLDRSAESVLVDLDVRGVQCSSGSACHAGQTDPSYVLLAIGLEPAVARNGLRLTLGPDTLDDDIDLAIGALREVLADPVAA